MIYIESKSTDPYFNLALEEYVFDCMDKDKEYFILWQNDNTIVVGKYQNTAQEINQEFVDAHGIKVVRRLSGGGAVYHDRGNLNFTFIVDQTDGFDFDFKRFAVPVVETLKGLGIKAEFTGRNDLVIDGKKFSGNSQYIKNGRVLHHGCIMVNSNLINVADALSPKEAKFESKSAKSVRSRVTTIAENSPVPITAEEFKDALKTHVLEKAGEAAGQNFCEYVLKQEDIEKIEKLAEEKYSKWEWNYGKSGNYNYTRSCRYDFGIVEVNAQVEQGVIQDISITGDFFGDGQISDVEDALKGLPVDDQMANRLEKRIDIGRYIKGMTSLDMQQLIR